MKKPVEAIERMRSWNARTSFDNAILSYLDSIPDDAHICKWPVLLTRERLDRIAACHNGFYERTDALRALAAIAPEAPKKRMVQLWQRVLINADRIERDWTHPAGQPEGTGWRKVAGPIEIEE